MIDVGKGRNAVVGKVNKVSYQPGKGDQFFHKYLYDAENRLTDVYTSRDELIWQQDAFYRYYLHGPLARTEIGQRKVQGLDYAYTLQGWIKGVNGVSNDATSDIGRDNYPVLTEFNHSTVSKDVFSYELDYFNSDYRAIGTTDQQFKYPFNNYATETSAVSRQLFNGNIIGMSTSLSQFGLAHYRYRYDQLNRLKEKHSFQQVTNSLQETSDFAEYLSYDANGNILTAYRNASLASPGGQVMDNLNYQYLNNTNKLNYVTDQVSASAKDYDIDGQPFQNYTYDKIGNLVADKQESITNINWSVYGKIRGIIKRNTTTGKETSTQYGYDPSGNRTYKEVIRRDIGNYSQDIADYTYYVRDAQGNTMATYTKHVEPANSPSLKWAEQHLYGSSRIGVMNLNLDIPTQTTVPQVNQTLVDSLHTGEVVYELSNHLGNVMATISDKKLFSNIVIPETGAAAFYYPEVLSQTDYYAFGQEIKERSYRISGGYRYGFNGKENDNEVEGEGSQQDYGMRIYDPRLGKFLSVDPITKSYPELTPYQFASNTPIQAIDLDGLEAVAYTYVNYQLHGSNGKLLLTKDFQVRDKSREVGSTKDFVKWMLTGESKQGISILYTRTVDRLGVEGKTTTSTQILGELYIPAKGDTKRGGFYFSAEGGGFGNSDGNSLSSGENNMISISLLLITAGFPAEGGEAENMDQFIKIIKNGGKDFKKLIEAAEGTIKGINGAFETGEKIKEGVNELKSMFKKGNVYYDEELGINLKRDTDKSGAPTDESAKDTLRNKKK